MTLHPFPFIHHEPEDLLTYLQQADRSQPVGKPLSGDCPASRWLSWLNRQPVAVTRDVIVIGSETYTTPVWLRDFQRGIDALGKEITARRAITVLTNVIAAYRTEARAA